MELSARFLGFTAYGVQWVLWLLIFLSITSIGMMLERLWHFTTYRPSPQALAREMRRLLASGPTLRLGSEGMGSAEALEGAVEGAKVRERLRLERNLAFLGTLGSNAPFIGLFGTVLGIIKAFHDLAGNQAGGPAVVMAGISEALVATAVGLMVAIPAVVAFNYFNRRVRTSMTQVDWMAYLALAEVKAGYAAEAAGTTPPVARTETHAEALTARSLGARLLPIVAVGGVLLLGGGILLGRSTSQPAPQGPAVALPIPSSAPNPLPPLGSEISAAQHLAAPNSLPPAAGTATNIPPTATMPAAVEPGAGAPTAIPSSGATLAPLLPTAAAPATTAPPGAPTGIAPTAVAPLGPEYTAPTTAAPLGTAHIAGAPTGTAPTAVAPLGTAHTAGAPLGTAHSAPTGTAPAAGTPIAGDPAGTPSTTGAPTGIAPVAPSTVTPAMTGPVTKSAAAASGAKTAAAKPNAAKPNAAKPAPAPAAAAGKSVKTWKGKKKRPPGAPPPAGADKRPAGAAPAKSEETPPAPSKTEDAAPAAPAVP